MRGVSKGTTVGLCVCKERTQRAFSTFEALPNTWLSCTLCACVRVCVRVCERVCLNMLDCSYESESTVYRE